MFAICQGLLLYCAGWTVYNTVPHTVAGWKDYKALLHNRTFVDLAASLAVRLVSTLIIYAISADGLGDIRTVPNFLITLL